MPSWERRVAPALRPYVSGWVAYDYRLPSTALHHGMPSASLTVVVAFDEGLDCGWLDGSGRGRFDVLVAGLHTRPSLIHTHGLQRGIQIDLTPLGARMLVGVPSGALARRIVEGTDVGWPRSLHHAMQDASWPRRSEILERFLLARLAHADPWALRSELDEAWRVLIAAGGRTRVADLAAHVGWSRRHLLARFREEFGLTPKEVARVARFEHARTLIRAGHPLAETAYDAGFADQSHLHREFTSLAALTPTQILGEFPFVHDAHTSSS
ncbi:helix-turn-helix transcriptional regulator [Mobilicoccus sp.]|uniref:helix-turn-helix transcriptional regulator n=1 Tax=Mobilicoccus sp. TaxID=2034349 RepID=UPI002896AC45|nr:helix-turn-helix transcriptional regulator [Mobilicoccus sp.]